MTTRLRRPVRAALLPLLALAVSVAGCAANDEMSSTDSGGAPTESFGGGTAGDVGGENEAPASDAGGDGTIDVPAFTPQSGRSLIVHMNVGLQVADVGDAVEALVRLDRKSTRLNSSH